MLHVHRTRINTTPSPPQCILGKQLLCGLSEEWLEGAEKHQWRTVKFLKLFFLLCGFLLETPRQKVNDIIREVHRACIDLWEDINVGTPLWCITMMFLSNQETTKSKKRRYRRMPSTSRQREKPKPNSLYWSLRVHFKVLIAQQYVRVCVNIYIYIYIDIAISPNTFLYSHPCNSWERSRWSVSISQARKSHCLWPEKVTNKHIFNVVSDFGPMHACTHTHTQVHTNNNLDSLSCHKPSSSI